MSQFVDRPYILMNMAMSADGKISSHERTSIQFSSVEDRRVMDQIRSLADAILIGANTLRTDAIHLWIKTEELVRQRIARGRRPQPINIVLSQSLNIPLDCRFFLFADTEKWIITGHHADADLCARFVDVAGLHKMPDQDGKIDLKQMLVYLKQQGIEILLLEGGSCLNYEMIAGNFVDELYLTLCPLIIGGATVATPVGGRGFSRNEFRNMELLDWREADGELFLHYRFKHNQIGLQQRYQSALGREEVFAHP